jgi:hypothetical protein
MSGEENKAVVRRLNQAMRRFWHTGHADALEGLLAPDFLQHWPGFPSDRQGYLEALQKFRKTFPDSRKRRRTCSRRAKRYSTVCQCVARMPENSEASRPVASESCCPRCT